MKQKNLVFVYGTLQKEFGNHRVMQRAGGEFIGKARTFNKYPLVVEGLPYLLDSRGDGENVEGEIYEVPDEGFSDLDQLEGHPNFYERRIKTFVLEKTEDMSDFDSESRTVKAWVYFLKSHADCYSDRTTWCSYKEAQEAVSIF